MREKSYFILLAMIVPSGRVATAYLKSVEQAREYVIPHLLLGLI